MDILLLFITIKNLQKQSLYIGKNAYQLLYFGQYEDSLNLAKLAVKINAKDEKLWLILAEAQIANKKYKNALNSLNKAEQINSNISEIYFAKSNVYLKISQQTKAKNALEKGIKIEPNNHKAIFQLGNITNLLKHFRMIIIPLSSIPGLPWIKQLNLRVLIIILRDMKDIFQVVIDFS